MLSGIGDLDNFNKFIFLDTPLDDYTFGHGKAVGGNTGQHNHGGGYGYYGREAREYHGGGGGGGK